MSAAAQRASAIDTASQAALDRLVSGERATWMRQALETNRALDETIGTCFQNLRDYNDRVYTLVESALARIDSDEIAPGWEAVAADLPGSVDACTIVFQSELTRPVRVSMNRPPPNGPRPPEDATDPTLSAIVEPGRALTHGLAGYYSVLHQAAQAEDLAALKAESDESAEAISGILSIAAQGSPLGSAAQTVAQSTIRLVAEIENARLTAARYDDILAALEAVDARDLELVEDVAGLTVLATLAGTLEAMAVNDLPFAIRRFNLIDPRDSAASEQALRDALAVAEDLRVVADTDVLGAVAEIAESHVELTKKVREREGETAATLRRIRDIGNDAADVADAVTGFIDGGDE